MTSVPSISITTPDLESKDYMASGATTPVTPNSPTVFDVVKEIENSEPFEEEPIDEAVDLSNGAKQKTRSFTIDDDEDDDVSQKPKTIKSFYNQKCILITGATGFIGKAILWKLIHSLHDSVDKIFIVLRQSRNRTPLQRLQEDILSNKAFVNLRRSMGLTVFDDFIHEKLYPFFGDLIEPNIGLSESDLHIITSQTNVIYHCAGNMDGNEYLQEAVRINTFGTLQVLTLAKKCHSISAFVHLSNLQHKIGGNESDENYLYPLPESASAIELLNDIMNPPFDNPKSVQFQPLYNNNHLFSKSLAEHIIVDEVTKNKQDGSQQFPIAIVRLSPVGPSVQEPLIGWADGVNGVNGTILLTGKGNRVIQPNIGDNVADVIPVDYVARLVIGCAATLTVPNEYEIPKVAQEIVTSEQTQPLIQQQQQQQQQQTQQPQQMLPSEYRRHKRTSSTASRTSVRSSMFYQNQSMPKLFLSGNTNQQNQKALPIIYQVSTAHMRPVTWKVGYETIRQYWSKVTNVNLPPAAAYFGASSANTTTGISRARTVMNSLKGYYMNSSPSTETSPPNSQNVSPRTSMSSERLSNRSSNHRLSRTIDKAIKLSSTLRDSLYASQILKPSSTTSQLAYTLRNMDPDLDFDFTAIIPEDVDHKFWVNYFTNASFGIHSYVCHEANLRLPTPIYGWNCAIHDEKEDEDVQVNSAIFSQDQINARQARMVAHIKGLLMHNIALGNKEKDDVWLTDLDDSLDDWCQDEEIIQDRRVALGKWRRKIGSNDESVKIIVLNDKRVNQAITQITQNAGVPKQTAVNEAMKILMRMSERTQLAFVWFTNSLLKTLFLDMFENVRISDDSLRAIRQATMGRRVVYVPVSKSTLDPLLVWYIAIRYQLPVPALACDESISQMGPISDIYRLAGAYYLKRDKSKRSPLNSAVTAAYTQVLLREHGALAFCLERSRSRTGKFQEAYPDGLVEMVIDATLQTNQTVSPSSNALSRVVSSEMNTPPMSPDSSSSSVNSPTMSIDSLAHNSVVSVRKVHKDVVFIPINITYENVPELPHLIDEVLDQQPSLNQARLARAASQAGSIPAPPSALTRPVRPSEAKDRRKTIHEGLDIFKKCGRISFGVGPLVSVQDIAEEYSRNSNSETYEIEIISQVTKRIHASQCKALIVSPVSIVSAIILYGRATHGVCIGKMKELMEWMRYEIIHSGNTVDWQEGEDLDSLILTAFKLLNESKNLIIDGRDINDDTNVRVNDHADNVMTLSYYANQMVNIFLLDAFFAVVYLSFSEESVFEDEFADRFQFLLQLLEKEFVINWDLKEKFDYIINLYVEKQIIRVQDNRLILLVNMENDHFRYEQLIFLASLIYPTIDAYWITSCSLSAFEAVPMLPRCIVPLLTQWIATHLITSRRTIYREVLSTESSITAVDVFMSMNFLTEIHIKEKLSPDAQILLHELGIPTSEILIELSGQNSDGGKTPVSPEDPEGMMKAMMAQIQMNRANSNMADLCQQIDSYRLGAASQRENFQNAQVFQKCLRQIKGILQANSSFAKRRRVDLVDDEEHLTQLVYSLLASSVPTGDRAAQARAIRRISEAYNLR